jgi:hypothetical protein
MLAQVHVTEVPDPAVNVSPPFGDTTVTAGCGTTENKALLTSFVALFDASLTRTRHCVEGVFGTVQAYVPAAADVPALIVLQTLPLFVVYSIFTFVTAFCAQVMLCALPTVQFSLPLGAVTEIVGSTGVSVVKLPEPEKALVPPAFFAFTLQ